VSLSHRKFGESTYVSSGHSWYHFVTRHSDPWCLPISMSTMQAAIYVPSTLLKHRVKCISPLRFSVQHALLQSIQDQQGVNFPSISEQVVFHLPGSIQAPPDRPALGNLDHPLCCVMLSVFIFSPDSIHHILHCQIQCVGAMLFNHSIIL